MSNDVGQMQRVTVVGGGASGIMAACLAARGGARVVLFEKEKALGRKVQSSGNGRCNISNTAIVAGRYHGKNPRFVNNVFSRFGLPETRDFFENLGLPFVEGKEGKLYPASLQATTVTRLLEYALQREGVEVRLHRRVDEIRSRTAGFTVVTAGKETTEVDAVILAAGSCAYPQLGGTNAGYELARSLGHTVIDPFPSLVPITIPQKIVHRLQGIKWDVGAAVACRGKTLFTSEGELLFTAYGLSGPVTIDISRRVNELVSRGEQPDIILDFFPGWEVERLRGLLDSLWHSGDKMLDFSLIGILHHRMPEVLLAIGGLDPGKKVASLTSRDKDQVTRTLKELRLTPGPVRHFNEAMVAAGGVDVAEINPTTLESKLCKGLYITGELLDIDGDSGGFNLQFAWSTGAIAGMSAGNMEHKTGKA